MSQLFADLSDDPSRLSMFPVEFPYNLPVDLLSGFMRKTQLIYNSPLNSLYDDILLQLRPLVRLASATTSSCEVARMLTPRIRNKR